VKLIRKHTHTFAVLTIYLSHFLTLKVCPGRLFYQPKINTKLYKVSQKLNNFIKLQKTSKPNKKRVKSGQSKIP